MKRALLIGIPFILLLVLVGWRYMQKADSGAKLQQRSSSMKSGAVNVVLGVAGPKDVDSTFEAVGMVASPYAVELSPKLTGKIVYLPDFIREGYEVKAGQLLCQLDTTETMGQVLQAKAQLAQAKSNLVSAKYIQHPTDTNIESQIAQAIATVRSNQADYDQVNENYAAQVHQAHSLVVDAQAKVAAAKAASYNAEASLGSANANLVDSKAKLNRENTLYKQGYVAAQDVDDAIAAEKVAEANVKVADGSVRAAKSAEESAQAQLRSAEDNESIVKKTGQTNIRAALEKVKQASAALKYSQSTTSQKPAYVAQLAADQAAVDAAEGNLNQALARLADCDLKSTIDGTISKRNADVGTVVNSGNSIVEIQYLKWLYVDSAVPIEYAGKISKGTRVQMSLDVLGGTPVAGVVTDLSNVADPQNRQFTAKIRIENADGRLRPGMYARVKFLISTKSYPVVVPREAVHTGNDGTSTVTTVDSGNVAHVVPVTIGEQDTNNIVVTSGVEAGDKVVVLSYTTVRDKQKVTAGGKGKGKKGGKDGASVDPNAPLPDGTPVGGGDAPATHQKGPGKHKGIPAAEQTPPASTTGSPDGTPVGAGPAPTDSASPSAGTHRHKKGVGSESAATGAGK